MAAKEAEARKNSPEEAEKKMEVVADEQPPTLKDKGDLGAQPPLQMSIQDRNRKMTNAVPGYLAQTRKDNKNSLLAVASHQLRGKPAAGSFMKPAFVP